MKTRVLGTLALWTGCFLISGAAAAAPCSASPTVLCLSGQRFAVEVEWKDFQGKTGQGQGVTLTPDTGYFWFFTDNNIELVVKVLDARAFNNKYWVFFGALSNVEYTLKVTDTVTGAVKSYVNPSGQFASIGDTAAFPGSTAGIAAARVKSVSPDSDRKAKAAAAFTPCPGTPRILSLSNCRFQLSVQWTDSQGGTGYGQAVQLTGDTGYFWFFTDNNVELIAKVLDARAFSGNFWTFYGALSNVKYTITVIDSVTGAYKRYENPSGSFASVGDTAAFRGGYSVAPAPDAGRAASADLDENGGSVTATGADGTVFTLEIPTGALQRPETVTMTPVSRIDRFPFSGGLAGGVEIEPSGLDLLTPAALTIRPAVPPPVSRTLPYSYSQGGEDFILYPRDVNTSSIRIPLLRLAGYGVGQGDPAEGASQADKPSTGPFSPYFQRYAREVLSRVLGQISQAELLDRGKRIYREAFSDLVVPILRRNGFSKAATAGARVVTCPLAEPGGDRDLENIFGVIRQKQMLGIVDEETGEAENGIDYAKAVLGACMQDSFDRCVSRNDPYEAILIANIVRQMVKMGVEDPLLTTFAEGSLLERCLRFELDFESKIVLEDKTPQGTATTRLKYRAATVPLRYSYAGNFYANRAIWEGACSLVDEVASIEFPFPQGSRCVITIDDPGKGTFVSVATWIDILKNPMKSGVRVLYDPGLPTAKAFLKCPDQGPINFPVLQWAGEYYVLHGNEVARLQEGTGFMANGWQQLRFGPGPSQNGEFFAMKSYQRGPIPWGSTTSLTEETFFFLKHTPDKAMPDCSGGGAATPSSD